jgi:hypothetical protein
MTLDEKPLVSCCMMCKTIEIEGRRIPQDKYEYTYSDTEEKIYLLDSQEDVRIGTLSHGLLSEECAIRYAEDYSGGLSDQVREAFIEKTRKGADKEYVTCLEKRDEYEETQ